MPCFVLAGFAWGLYSNLIWSNGLIEQVAPPPPTPTRGHTVDSAALAELNRVPCYCHLPRQVICRVTHWQNNTMQCNAMSMANIVCCVVLNSTAIPLWKFNTGVQQWQLTPCYNNTRGCDEHWCYLKMQRDSTQVSWISDALQDEMWWQILLGLIIAACDAQQHKKSCRVQFSWLLMIDLRGEVVIIYHRGPAKLWDTYHPRQLANEQNDAIWFPIDLFSW